MQASRFAGFNRNVAVAPCHGVVMTRRMVVANLVVVCGFAAVLYPLQIEVVQYLAIIYQRQVYWYTSFEVQLFGLVLHL